MEGLQDTSGNDMSFELTGPAITIPHPYHQFNHATKRDFNTFFRDAPFRPAEQHDPPAFDGNNPQHNSTITSYGEEAQQRVTSWMQWGLFRSLAAIQLTSNLLQAVYAATLIVAVPVAAAKRRLVSIAPDIPAPAPICRVLKSRPHIPRLFRQHHSPIAGQRSTTPITPPRFKPKSLSSFHIPGEFPASPLKSPGSLPVTQVPTRVAVDDGTGNSPHGAIDTPMDLPDQTPIDENMIPVYDQRSPIKIIAAPPSAYQIGRADELKKIRKIVSKVSPVHAKKKCRYSISPKPLRAGATLSSLGVPEQPDSLTQLITSVQKVLQENGSTNIHEPSSNASNLSNTPLQQAPVTNPSALDQNNTNSDESIESTRSLSDTFESQDASLQQASASNPNPLHPRSSDESIELTRSSLRTSRPQDALVHSAPNHGSRVLDEQIDELIESTRSSSGDFVSQQVSVQPVPVAERNTSIQIDSAHDASIESPQPSSNISLSQDLTRQQALSAEAAIDDNRSSQRLSQSSNPPDEQALPRSALLQAPVSNNSRDSAILGNHTSVFDESIESTRSSPDISRQQNAPAGQPPRPDGLIESTRSSPSVSKENDPATDGLIRSTRSPLDISSKQGALTTILKPSNIKSPKRGFLGQLISSLKNTHKRTSPLGERLNGTNVVPKTPINKYARFHENPVTKTRKYVKGETISYPSAHSSRDGNSILSQTMILDVSQLSPTQQEQDAMIADQLMTTVVEATNPIPEVESPGTQIAHDSELATSHESSESSHPHSSINSSSQLSLTPVKAADTESTTPPSQLTRHFEGLGISGRRSSLRSQDKELKAEQQRLEQERVAAEKKALKEKEEADEKARIEAENAKERERIAKAEAEEKARTAKAEAEELARKKAQEEEDKKKSALRIPIDNVVPPLSQAWEQKVAAALANAPGRVVAHTSRGTEITRRDIGMVLPQHGTQDPANGWLNDAIIEAYLQAIVDHGNEAAGHKRGETPKFHAFNNFFYNNLKEGGYDKVRRWAGKAKIGGTDLLNVEWVFIPVNVGGSHWTLIAVSPTRRTIEYYDSFHGRVTHQFRNIKVWLKGELKNDYKPEEWKVVEDSIMPGMGKGPSQLNGSDCGVFTLTTAKMLSLGVDPMAYGAGDMPMQRRRIVAELIHGGLTDEFKPIMRFE